MDVTQHTKALHTARKPFATSESSTKLKLVLNKNKIYQKCCNLGAKPISSKIIYHNGKIQSKFQVKMG